MKIDSHLHFWKYHPVKDAWITDDMDVLKSDFMPEDLLSHMSASGLALGLLVQADQSEEENRFLLDIAKEHECFPGVVGWVDFRNESIDDRLAYYASEPLMKGFRHIVQSEPDPNFLLNPQFAHGISMLKKYDFTYDVLIYPRHLDVAHRFCQEHNDQKLLIDHIGKPDIKNKNFSAWKKDIEKFKNLDHVYCKLAGLITEADWKQWKIDDFKEVLDICLSVFGSKRLMFGSDWPVCLLGGSYADVCEIIEANISQLSTDEQADVWGKTCQQFYNIQP